MKKLNITKEQFNKSRYFKNKYGKLEYVSESGRLFKTNKGKVLMFKESASKKFEEFCEELKTKFSDIDGVKIYMMDNEDGSNTITVSIRRFDDARSVWYPEDVKKIGQFIKRKCDRFGWTVDKNVEYRLGITDFYITEIESSDDVVKESTKKFGRRFKESFDTYDEFEALGDELEAKYKRCKYAEAELYVDDDGTYTIAVRIDTDHKDESKEMNRFLAQQSKKHHWRLEKEPNIYDPVRERRVDEFYLYVV